MTEQDDLAGDACADEPSPVPIEDSMTPSRLPNVSVRDAGEDDGKHVAFEPELELVFLMNSAGKHVFDLCDGNRTVEDIVDHFADEYEIPDDVELHEVVVGCLAALRRTRFIELI